MRILTLQRFPFHRGLLLAGWTIILLLSLLLYNALLRGSLLAQSHRDAVTAASLAASHLNMKIDLGSRLGKKLVSFRGLRQILEQSVSALPGYSCAAILSQQGIVVHTAGTPDSVPPLQELLHGKRSANQAIVAERSGFLDILLPIETETSSESGYFFVRMPQKSVSHTDRGEHEMLSSRQIAIIAAACVFYAAVLAFFPFMDAEGALRKNRLRGLSLAIFILVMGISSFNAAQSFKEKYAATARDNAAGIGRFVSHDVNRLLLVGMSLGSMTNVADYLTRYSRIVPDNDLLLRIVGGSGETVLSSHAASLADEPAFTVSVPLVPMSAQSEPEAGVYEPSRREDVSWSIAVDVLNKRYTEAVRSQALDAMTLLLVALAVMFESFLLFFHFLERRSAGGLPEQEPSKDRSLLLRHVMFLLVLAMDMSISFIPLRMAEFFEDAASKEVLLGAPVSAEMAMTGLSIIVAGFWMKRQGVIPPMTWGLCIIAAGYLGSMLAPSPAAFVAARGLAGFGYGLVVLAAQAYTVRDGMLAYMFAGVYAGALCGSALGAMLAERLGYNAVFGVSCIIILLLSVLPWLLFSSSKPGPEAERSRPSSERASPGLYGTERLRQWRALLANPAFLALIFFSLVPSAFLAVGLLNYFLPLYLNEAGVGQSDIGRIFMLYCLIIILIGPLAEKGMHARWRPSLVVFAGGILGSMAILSYAFLTPFTGAVCCALFLGFATSCNVPGHSACLLSFEAAKIVGVEQSMGLLNAVERVGQVLSPLCLGAIMALAGVNRFALWAGVGYAVASILFLILAWRNTSREIQRGKQ